MSRPGQKPLWSPALTPTPLAQLLIPGSPPAEQVTKPSSGALVQAPGIARPPTWDGLGQATAPLHRPGFLICERQLKIDLPGQLGHCKPERPDRSRVLAAPGERVASTPVYHDSEGQKPAPSEACATGCPSPALNRGCQWADLHSPTSQGDKCEVVPCEGKPRPQSPGGTLQPLCGLLLPKAPPTGFSDAAHKCTGPRALLVPGALSPPGRPSPPSSSPSSVLP